MSRISRQLPQYHSLSEAQMAYEEEPEHVKLAVDMIRQMENLDFPEDTVLEACLLVMQDTLNKLPGDHRLEWRQRLGSILSAPGSYKHTKTVK